MEIAHYKWLNYCATFDIIYKHTAATQRDSEESFCIVSLEKFYTYALFIVYVYEIKVPYFPELEVTMQKLAQIT